MVEEIAIGQQFSQGSTNVGVKLFTSIFILGRPLFGAWQPSMETPTNHLKGSWGEARLYTLTIGRSCVWRRKWPGLSQRVRAGLPRSQQAPVPRAGRPARPPVRAWSHGAGLSPAGALLPVRGLWRITCPVLSWSCLQNEDDASC